MTWLYEFSTEATLFNVDLLKRYGYSALCFQKEGIAAYCGAMPVIKHLNEPKGLSSPCACIRSLTGGLCFRERRSVALESDHVLQRARHTCNTSVKRKSVKIKGKPFAESEIAVIFHIIELSHRS